MKSPAIIFGILLFPAVSHALIDTNTNGVSDLWEQAHNNGQLFPQTFDPQADPDQDGWTNAQEAAAGTDPNNANPPDGILRPDVAHIPAIMGTDGNGQPIVITPESVVISWTTLPGKQYTLLRSFDLTGSSWQPFDAPFIGNGNLVEYGYPAADADRLFVRVAVSDVDSEEDGLTDAEEIELNTDPELEDSDFDGLTDAEEIALDIDPNDSDSDDDGVSDGNEIAQETDPNDSDTDNDLSLDGKDADPKEILVDWERTSEAVYALIDVDGPPGEIARDLNDMGEVLFTTGLWSGGNYALIPPPAPLSGSFPSGGETQTYDVDLIGYQSFNSDLKVTGWSHVRYTSGQAAGGDGTDTAWAQSLGQSAEHLADAVPFNSTNVLSMQPMGVDNSGRTFSRNSYAFYSPPEVMHEGRRIVVSGLPGNDPPVFLQPANGYYVDGQTWEGHADVSRSGALVTNTASAIDDTPNKSYQLAMWDSSLGEVALPSGTDTWFYPIHLNDLPNGKPALAATTTGAGGDGVYLKNPVTGHMEKCESLSGKHIQLFAGDGSAITGDHQLWRNGKLTPMRNLCERYGNLLDAGWDFRPLESNKHGAFLLVATGPNGEQENKLAVKVIVKDNDRRVASGVDDMSITAKPTDIGYQKDYWIMAPSGTVPAGLDGAGTDCANATKFLVTYDTGGSLRINTTSSEIKTANPFPIQVTNPANDATWPTVTWHGNANETKNDSITWEIGAGANWTPVDLPVKVKVMKNRTVRLAVWIVRFPGASSPVFTPAKLDAFRILLRDRLNQVFAYQMNAWFDVSMKGEFDFGETDGTRSGQQPSSYITSVGAKMKQMIDSHRDGVSDINLYLVKNVVIRGASGEPIAGYSFPSQSASSGTYANTCVVELNDYPDDNPNPENSGPSDRVLRRSSHEIGHMFVGEGHPDKYDSLIPAKGGIAPLQSLSRDVTGKRVMHSSPTGFANAGLFIKGEWDEAEKWLNSRPNGDN